jgi:hypothetical protein
MSPATRRGAQTRSNPWEIKRQEVEKAHRLPIAVRMSTSGLLGNGTANTMISVVHQGTIKPTVLVRLAVRCALVVLLCATKLGMARDGAGRLDNRPVNLGVVRQAHVEPRTITLPVVDGRASHYRIQCGRVRSAGLEQGQEAADCAHRRAPRGH